MTNPADRTSFETKRWQVIAFLLGLYAVGFFVFYPSIPTVSDEAYYLLQAKLFAEGRTTSVVEDPYTGEQRERLAGDYPIGTSLGIAPLFLLFGLEGAYLFPLIVLLLTVVVTGKWISERGRSPLFALIILGYPSALAMGRIPMSGLPSACLVALGFWLFWRGQGGNGVLWFLSAFLAGVSLLFREMNPLLFAPLFLGALIRREEKAWWLVAGGLIGVAARSWCSYLVFGDIFYVRSSEAAVGSFRLDATIYINLLIYPISLLVFVPGGLIWSVVYRGERRVELLLGIGVFFLLIMAHATSARFASPWKAFLNHGRLLIPLLPVMAFQMAEAVPRWWSATSARISGWGRSFSRLPTVVVWVWLAVIGGGSVGTHAVLSAWSSHKAEVRDAIHGTVPEGAVIFTNRRSTVKYINALFGHHLVGEVRSLYGPGVESVLDRHGEFYVVVHERFDSNFWKEKNAENEAIVARLSPTPTLLLDKRFAKEDRLLIWVVRDAR